MGEEMTIEQMIRFIMDNSDYTEEELKHMSREKLERLVQKISEYQYSLVANNEDDEEDLDR